MHTTFVRLPSVFSKYKEAERENKSFFIFGTAGSGKTTVTEHYFKRISHRTLSAVSGRLTDMPDLQKMRQSVIVIDGVSWLTDHDSIQYVIKILKDRSFRLILLGNSNPPDWLSKYMKDFVIITPSNLYFQKGDIEKYFDEIEMHVDEDTLNRIVEDVHGNPFCLKQAVNCIYKYGKYTQECSAEVMDSYYRYFDSTVFGQLDEECRDLMLKMSAFERFDAAMADAVTGGSDSEKIIRRISEFDSSIILYDGSGFLFSEMASGFLNYKKSLEWSLEENRDNLKRGADHYWAENLYAESFECMQKAGDPEYLAERLKEYTFRNYSFGSIYPLRAYYQSLPEETVKASFELTYGLSMISFAILRFDDAKYYYELCKAKPADADPERRQRHEEMLSYLKLVLNTKTGNAVNAEMLSFINKDGSKQNVHEAAVNAESLILAVTDYAHLAEREAGYLSLAKELDHILFPGREGCLRTLVRSILAYERNKVDWETFIGDCNSAYMAAESEGVANLCLVILILEIKYYISAGNAMRAAELTETMQKKARRESYTLMDNMIRSQRQQLTLLRSNAVEAKEWLAEYDKRENEITMVNVPDSIIQVKTLIFLQNYERALEVIGRLEFYTVEYHKTYNELQTKLLKAIIYYRKGINKWKELLEEVIEASEEIGFTALIASEGKAVREMIEKVITRKETDKFRQELRSAVSQWAEYYPNYLSEVDPLPEPLTATEKKVLRMLCQELSTDEICKTLNVTYSGLKYHNNNIYKKLNVKSRGAAIRKAAILGLNQ